MHLNTVTKQYDNQDNCFIIPLSVFEWCNSTSHVNCDVDVLMQRAVHGHVYSSIDVGFPDAATISVYRTLRSSDRRTRLIDSCDEWLYC